MCILNLDRLQTYNQYTSPTGLVLHLFHSLYRAGGVAIYV